MNLQGTVDDWRQDILDIARRLEDVGHQKYEWLSANDEHVCSQCANRNGKVFSMEELERELEGPFCCPGDSDDRCRCMIIATESSYEDFEYEGASQVGHGKKGCTPFVLLIAVLPLGLAAILGHS